MTDNLTYRRQYHEDKAFRDYVDKYCRDNKVTVAAALEHRLVQEVGKQYTESAQFPGNSPKEEYNDMDGSYSG